MNGGPSGFHNAPVTKTVVVASAFLTFLAGIQGRSLRLGLSYQDIFGKFPLWKLIASTLAFSSTPEMIFGLYLLYYFRVFERQIGSNKHTVFIIFSILLSLILEALALAYLRETLSKVASGPYGLIFAAFLPFYFDIPISSRFRVFGLNFTDKSLIYLAGLQLLFSSWKRSIVPGLCGLFAGSLYRLNVLGIRKLKFPEAFLSVFSRLPLPSSGSSPISSRGNTTGNMRPYSGHQMEPTASWLILTSHLSIETFPSRPEDKSLSYKPKIQWSRSIMHCFRLKIKQCDIAAVAISSSIF